MSNVSKFLPALALAAALTPFAANARSDQSPVQDPAHQYLVSVSGAGQVATNAHGRASERNTPAGLIVGDAAQYAAAVSQQALEN